MHRRKLKLAALAMVAALPLPAAAAVPASAARPPDPSAVPALTELLEGQPKSYDLTLVTGDTVHVRAGANGEPQMQTEVAARSDGRTVLVQTLVDADHVYVLPSDVLPLVAAGRVDRRLFDVKQLIADGYADGATGTLPVIVKYAGKPANLRTAQSRAAAQSALHAKADALPGSRATRALESVNGASLAVAKKQASSFWSTVSPKNQSLGAGVAEVWLDGRVRASLDESVPLTGAPQAWAAGLDGSGVKVAVLDTGIDANHPDLAGKVVDSKSFVPGVPSVADGHGHGTHVASTVAGTGSQYKGVAPGANLVVGKVLADDGWGEDSWIIDGMEWAAASGAKVVSMSLGGGASDGTDPMSQSLNTLTASTGTLFVVAAGNSGPSAKTVSWPSAADAALTVGAVDKSGVLAAFSSRGPRRGNYGLKPEIAAPGVGITAAKPGGGYQSMNGTSMATPHVAGAAAIVAQQHPDWTATQIKAALVGTTKADSHTVYQTGSGQLDVAATVRTAVLPQTSTVDYGGLWHPQDSTPVTRTVTYRNTGAQAVTLDLSTAVTAEDGSAAPAGMFTVSPSTVEVPAGGTAEVTVTLIATMGPAGLYSGDLVATATGVSLRVPIGAYKEPVGFDLTIDVPAPSGAANVMRGSPIVRRIDQDGEWIFPEAGETHLPAGVYAVRDMVAWGAHPKGDLDNLAVLAAPQVEVTADMTVTLDPNKAKKIEFRTDHPAVSYAATMNTWHTPANGGTTFGVVAPDVPSLFQVWALPTEQATVGKFYFDHTHIVGSPVITASVPELRRALHPVYQHYSASAPKLSGQGKLPLVDLGTGTDADFARARLAGKVALLHVGDGAMGPFVGAAYPSAAVLRAKNAGAKAVLIYGNEGLPFRSNYPIPHSIYPLPLLAVPAEEGRAVRDQLARGRATFQYRAQSEIPHLYTLSYLDQGGIPSDLSYRVSDRDLVTVDQRTYADKPVAQQQMWGPRWPGVLDLDDFSASFSAVTLYDIPAPYSRTEHIGPTSADLLWSRQAMRYDMASFLADGPGHHLDDFLGSFGTANVFDRPGMIAETWGKTAAAPGVATFDPATAGKLGRNGAPCVMCRISGLFGDQDAMVVWPFSVDPSRHIGDLTTWSNDPEFNTKGGFDRIHLYANGQELPQQSFAGAPGLFPYYLLPDEPTEYRLTQHFKDQFDDSFGTEAKTTWTFKSAAVTANEVPADYDALGLCAVGGCRTDPLILLDYDFNLRLDNRAAPGVHAFTVNPYRQPSTTALPKIIGFKIWASYDGGTSWQQLAAIRTADGRYRALTVSPPGATGAVSLRTEVWDAAGNRVEQILPAAYGLSKI